MLPKLQIAEFSLFSVSFKNVFLPMVNSARTNVQSQSHIEIDSVLSAWKWVSATTFQLSAMWGGVL